LLDRFGHARFPDEGATDPVDWTKPDSPENRTREALLKSDKSYITEPIRKDPAFQALLRAHPGSGEVRQ